MKLSLPLYIMIPRKTKEDKKIALNLNIYRNLNHFTNNQAKVIFKDDLAHNINHLGCHIPAPPYRFTYTLYHPNNRAVDLENVLSIVSKFTEDALVELELLPDDNHKIIPEVKYVWGGVDKENPRAELEITSL